MPIRMEILRTEIQTDPLARGYAGMTDQQILTSLTAVNRTKNRDRMDSSEVLNAIDVAEFNALLPNQQTIIWNLLGLGSLNPFGTEATLIRNVFGVGSTTVSTLAARRTTAIDRATELGIIGVQLGHIQNARA